MASVIFWVIFFVIIIAALKKTRRNTNIHGKGTSYSRQKRPVGQDETVKQQTSYAQSAYSQKPVYEKKKASFTERKKKKTAPAKAAPAKGGNAHQMTLDEVYDRNHIVAAAKANAREVELDNDYDASNEKLLESVYDIMVKGPNDTIAFQRDFLAEGMDMLNSFQAGNE